MFLVELWEWTMRLLTIAALGLAALTATASVTQAADGCGRGRYYNGYRCVPMRDVGPTVRIGPGPGYGGYYRPRGPNCYSQGCCPPHYTIQDGVCKPYRGY
jgi:hypothetical protein